MLQLRPALRLFAARENLSAQPPNSLRTKQILPMLRSFLKLYLQLSGLQSLNLDRLRTTHVQWLQTGFTWQVCPILNRRNR